jgi:4-hydroxybenzoate polyprenyltransferase/phosphoserine phosphatase
MNKNSTLNYHNIIVVDLDGTLIKTDILWESLLLLAKQKPFKFLIAPLWLLSGKSYFKKRIFDYVSPDVSVFPYNEELLSFLQKSKEEGKTLILASATDERIVKQVSEHLHLFDSAFGTTANNNLKGKHKLELINHICNGNRFDYVGNEKADIPIWHASEKAYAVTNSKKLIDKIPKKSDKIHIFSPPRNLKTYLKALRPHQWVKNILLFVPLVLSHEITSVDRIFDILISFFAMSLCASSIYILNDLLDIESDRYHSKKKNRPFAAGLISVPSGLAMSCLLLFISFLVGLLLLSHQFIIALLSYFILTTIYSLFLKKYLLLDVITLSALYSLRVYAGSVAISIFLTPWLIAFSSFFFLSLAFLKRYVELKEIEFGIYKKLKGRSYISDDIQVVQTSGITSGYMSVLIFYLYITNSKEVAELYSNQMWLWFIGPFLIYWLTRIWILAKRGNVDSDPILFAIKDGTSWIIGIVISTIILLGALS